MSVRLDGEYRVEDVCISVPARLGRHGVEALITLDLTEKEQAAFESSAMLPKRTLAGIEPPARPS